MARGSERLAKLAAVLMGLVLALGVLEIGLRLAPGAISPRLLILFEPGLRERIASGTLPVQRDFVEIERDDHGRPLLIWKSETRIVSIDDERVRSDARQTDEIGFCNRPGSYAARERLDLIAIGDSFTFCHGVEATDTWSHKLGARTGLATYNLGRGGCGPYEYLQLLRHFGLAKRPRIVVMNLYAGNDLRDAVRYAEHRDALLAGREPPSDVPRSVLPAVTHGPLGRHSYAVNLLVAFASRSAARQRQPSGKSGIDFRYTLELDDGPLPFNTGNRDRDEVVYARRLEQGAVSLQVWADALRRFAELAREHGFAAVVTYMPSAHEAYAERVRFEDETLRPELARLGDAQRDFLAAAARELDYAFFDLTDALQAAARKGGSDALLYDPSSVHLTALGNDVVAGALAHFLESRGLARTADASG